jgi:hypothetical protein
MEFFRRQTQLPHLVIERSLGNPQGAAHQRRVAVMLGERIFDQRALKPSDLVTERNLRKGASGQNTEGVIQQSEYEAVSDVAELSDVSWPIVTHQFFQLGRGDDRYGLVVAARGVDDEMLEQQRVSSMRSRNGGMSSKATLRR